MGNLFVTWSSFCGIFPRRKKFQKFQKCLFYSGSVEMNEEEDEIFPTKNFRDKIGKPQQEKGSMVRLCGSLW